MQYEEKTKAKLLKADKNIVIPANQEIENMQNNMSLTRDKS
jgi:glycine cleavage system regulatory protein